MLTQHLGSSKKAMAKIVLRKKNRGEQEIEKNYIIVNPIKIEFAVW